MKIKILLILLYLSTIVGYAQVSDATLTTQANVIRNETTPGANTARRVGDMFLALINSKPNLSATILTGTASGTNSYTATISPVITSYITFQRYLLKFTNANTADSITINLNSLGAKNVYKSGSTIVDVSDIKAGQIYLIVYDGTAFQIIGDPPSGSSGTGTVQTVSVTTANGVSGSVANATTTPAITLTLGAITPTSVNSVVVSGSSTPTLAVTGTTTVSGANTGDQTITLTSDVTGSGTGSFATTIAANAVTYAKLQQSGAGMTLLGRAANSTGNYAEITASFDGEIPRRNGTSIGFGSINLNSVNAVGTSLLRVNNGGLAADLSTTGGTGQYLKQASTGAAITVGTIPSSDVTGAALTKTDDTNVTLTLGGSPTTALLNASSLTLGWNGTLAAARLNSNVAQAITNDTNVTGSISSQNLTLGWTGTLAYSRFVNGGGLSVVGRSANSSGVQADITGTTDQVFRVNGAGTSLGFGSIDLSKSATVGSTILPIANGGTNSATQVWWGLSGTSTLTGSTTITSNTASQLNYGGTWTGTASNQYHIGETATITGRAGNADNIIFKSVTPTITAGANNQVMIGLDLNPTFANGGFTGTVNYGLLVRSGRVGMGNAAPSAALHVTGTGSTSSTETLRVANSTGNMFHLLDDAAIRFGSSGTRPSMYPSNGDATIAQAGASLTFSTSAAPASNQGAVFVNNSATTLANIMALGGSFTQSSGVLSGNAFRMIPTINTTSTYAGVFVGIDYNPTLTSVTGLTHYGLLIKPTAALNGFGTSTPISTVEVNGSLGTKIQTVSATTTLDVTHYTVLVDASGGAVTINLPAVASTGKRRYTIKKIDSSGNAVTIDGNASETIDGATTQSLATQYKYQEIHCDGAAWYIVGNN